MVSPVSVSYSLDDIGDIVLVLDVDGLIRYANSASERILGQHLAVTGLGIEDVVHPEDADAVGMQIRRLIQEPGGKRTFEFRLAHADGSWRYFQAFGSNNADNPRILGSVVHCHDVTDLHDAEDRLVFERIHDRLTGLPARVLLTEFLDRALRRAHRVKKSVAIFAVNIDGLSRLNERLGLRAGDDVIIRVGRDLEALVRDRDMVARTGSVVGRLEDGFFVLCEDIPNPTVAAAMAERMAATIRGGSHESEDDAVTATIGVVLSSPDSSAESLLVDATSALDAGKALGGDRVEFFDEALRQDAHRRITDIRQLSYGIANGELRVVYQPQVDTQTGRLRGVEALVRWHHHERGVVPPMDFIPLAEESGLIGGIGAFVLGEACRQRAAWNALVDDPADFVMAVNVSGRQLNESLPGMVASVLADTGVDASSLCIEITESVIMNDVESAIATMRSMQELGSRISIDDFGTGYSSLALLKELPFDELKVDRAFVKGLGAGPADTAIVSAIVTVARALGLSVVAEGVESLEQLRELRDLGCELAQGFLFSRPVQAEEIEAMLAGTRSLSPGPGEG